MSFPKNILIVRTDRLGDVVLSLPLAAIIKKYSPQTKITFLLREYTKPLAVNNPFIDEVLILEEENGRPSIGKNVARLKNKFDACIVAYPTFPIAQIIFLSKIPLRIATGYRWYSFLFNKKVYEHRKYGEHHELEYNVHLLHQLGINETVTKENVLFGLDSDKTAKEKITAELKSLGMDFTKPIVVVHPGSGGSAIDLPKEKLREVINKLAAERVEILITGSWAEKELCDSMVVNSKVINTAGKYNLTELTALIDCSNILIANSTGPIHIAAALGKNVIGFYPKFAAVSPERWGPYTNKAKIFQPEIDCADCSRAQCENLNCMNSIRVNDIVDAAKKIIGISFSEME